MEHYRKNMARVLTVLAVGALAVTGLAACDNGGRNCQSAPAPAALTVTPAFVDIPVIPHIVEPVPVVPHVVEPEGPVAPHVVVPVVPHAANNCKGGGK